MNKLSFREDWPVIPYFLVSFLGVIVSILDFIFIQQWILQINIWFITAIVLLLPIIYLRTYPRKILRNAGFPNLVSTARLQIVENHRLVKDGLYNHVRHPLYTGEFFRAFLAQLFFSSLIGIPFSILAICLLLIRIQIEERMLIDKFGNEYELYKKNTKKLIPFIY
ncbi:MAG: methyltransferase family protein [Candidatus Hodarchaeales archaeon]